MSLAVSRMKLASGVLGAIDRKVSCISCILCVHMLASDENSRQLTVTPERGSVPKPTPSLGFTLDDIGHCPFTTGFTCRTKFFRKGFILLKVYQHCTATVDVARFKHRSQTTHRRAKHTVLMRESRGSITKAYSTKQGRYKKHGHTR